MAEVEAAMTEWNAAEPGHPVLGPSWVITFAQVLIAAHNTHVPQDTEAHP